MSQFWNLVLLGPGHRCDLLDHGVGPGAHLHDVGHLQLRPRRGRVRDRVPLLPAEHRARCADRARADHLRVHLRPAARVCCSTASCSGGSRRRRSTRASSARSACSSRCPALVQWLVVSRRQRRARSRLRRQRRGHQRRARPRRGVPRPHHNYKIGGVVLNSDQIAVFVVAALAAIVLWFVIRRTRVGLEMRAVVDRESLAGLRGVNAARTSAAAWIMTMILAGLGGVLIAPLFQSAGLRLHARRARLARRGRARRTCGRSRSRSPVGCCSASSRTSSPATATTSFPSWLEQPQRAQVGGAVPARSSCCCSSSSAATGRGRAGSVADDVPRPDHRDGTVEAGAAGCRGRSGRSSLIAFSLQWFGVGRGCAPTPTTRPSSRRASRWRSSSCRSWSSPAWAAR